MRLDELNHRLKHASPVYRLRSDRQRLDDLQGRLERTTGADLQLRSARQAALFARLQALSPLAVLQRGYALVQANGVVIRRSADLAAGQQIQVRMTDGEISATVTGVRPDSGNSGS